MNRALFSLLLSLALVLSARAELIVRNPVAGFGGGFVPERFNLLSVEVVNTGSQPFEGVISIDDGGFSGSPVRTSQPLFVSPGSSRWVQFYPYVTGYQRWQISWSDAQGRGDSMSVLRDEDSVRTGAPVTVVFNAPDSPVTQQTRLRPFMENLFPPSVTGTTGLYAAVMDHVPRWDAPRRQAFRDWVYRGGIVHLLQGVDGKFPEFEGELAPLNITGKSGTLGAGRIVRHEKSRQTIEAKDLGEEPKMLSDGTGHMTDVSGLLVNRLSDITRPNIPWPFIYLLTVLYVVLIGPVFYFQRKRDYRVMLGAFVGTVALFAWLFTVVGRRGYGEQQVIHSVGYAESLGGNRHLVTQWMHAFATRSGKYNFQYPAGGGHAYATLTSSGTVRADVVAGAEAALHAEIPLFSARPFVHGGTLAADDTSVEITAWEVPGQLEKFRIKPNPNFPKNVKSMYAVHRRRLYDMTPSGNEWVAESPANSKDIDSFTDGKQFNYYGYYSFDGEHDPKAPMSVRLERRLSDLGTLFTGILTGSKAHMRQRISTPDPGQDTVRLFTYAQVSEAWPMPATNFKFGGGYILYSQTLQNPAPSK